MDKKLVPTTNPFTQTYDAMTHSNHATYPIILPIIILPKPVTQRHTTHPFFTHHFLPKDQQCKNFYMYSYTRISKTEGGDRGRVYRQKNGGVKISGRVYK